ncbi:transcription initiation factor IIA subunit 1-like [Ruditapes philippinarum]|uniref:transcription initiation factor IIA subunit 1-like n=1 Tax=Ruditapes philippinarum TaxID=129788 RepID=UPI00295AE247|nr:transcription initiation factor IIA subunit 1-like [Ruditapes philippinarum]
MTTPNYARKLYFTVVEDVLTNVKEAFLDEGVDEQVLQELKQLWEGKLTASRALDPADPEPVVPSNIPYPLLQQQQSNQPTVVPAGSGVQQQIPIPVQINQDGQISNAASMAFSAQGGMFPQQLQALVNVNPGAQLTLQQTANGQYILQALTPSGQGQMVSMGQQIIQAQPGQIQQVQGQNLPQFDGVHDEKHTDTTDTEHRDTDTLNTEQPCSSQDSEPSCSGACGCYKQEVEIEFEASKAMSKKLARDIKRSIKSRVPQLDGNHDTSSSDDDDYDDDDGNDDDDEKEDGEEEGEEEEPLNSDDDVSEEDPTELFDTDNVVVCQFEKISRNKSKWKFNLKDGIMNLEGKDHVFQRGIGDAEW